jgi:hypothetical protein
MNYVGNLDLGQLTKLFIMFELSVMLSLDICGLQESILFEIQSLAVSE